MSNNVLSFFALTFVFNFAVIMYFLLAPETYKDILRMKLALDSLYDLIMSFLTLFVTVMAIIGNLFGAIYLITN